MKRNVLTKTNSDSLVSLEIQQRQLSIEDQRVVTNSRIRDSMCQKIEQARRNVEVLMRVPFKEVEPEVLESLKINIKIMNEVKDLK